MKKLILLGSVLTALLMSPGTVQAQVRVGVSINIGDQPAWRVRGYDYVEYYYLPEIECYYYVPRRQFIYLSGGNWVFSANLPARYRGYDLYNGYKVVINQPRAYQYYQQHRVKYHKGNYYRGNNGHHHGKHYKKHKRHH